MDGVRFPTTCYKCRLNQTERMGAWIWQGDAGVETYRNDRAGKLCETER